MINETLNYIFEIKEETNKDLGVIHIYKKNNNMWVGFIRFDKLGKYNEGKPLVRFYAEDIVEVLDQQFHYELSYYTQELAKQWQEKEGEGIITPKSKLSVDFGLEIDKGDGKGTKKIVV